jgi:hypothetical protein
MESKDEEIKSFKLGVVHSVGMFSASNLVGLKNRHIDVRLFFEISLVSTKNFRQVQLHTLPTADLNHYSFLFALKSFNQRTKFASNPDPGISVYL